MSEFVQCETKFKDKQALIDALVDMGWKLEQIEVCDKAEHLYGYHDDKRPEKANIIIRRNHVGGSSNDIGFVKEKDGTYRAIISEFDSSSAGLHARQTGGYNQKWLGLVNAKYAERLFTRHAKKKGYDVKRVTKKVDGKDKVVLELYK